MPDSTQSPQTSDTRLPHGGDTSAAEAAFGAPKAGWLDLSTGINPLPFPVPALDAGAWQRLPTPAEDKALLAAAAAYYGTPPDAGLVAAPGTQALIQVLPRLRAPGTVAVLAPTYGEHAHRWESAGHQVNNVDTLDEADADVVVIVNPNNPDGRAISPGVLVERARHQATRGGLLVVDEAFADVAPEISVTAAAGTPGLLILRSFGKFFGLAGVRLGFAIGAPFLTDALADALGPWAVSGPTIETGRQAFAGRVWQTETRARLEGDAARLDTLLQVARLKIVGGTTLFRLAAVDDAGAVYEKLGRAGILVRVFPDNPHWLRFGLPGNEAGWTRLTDALR